MTRAQVIPLLVFFGVIFTMIIGLGTYDVWLAANSPDADLTISWIMALLGYKRPIIPFLWGLLAAVPVGLGFHFYALMPTPEEWTELQTMQWQLAQLQAAGVNIPTPPPDFFTPTRR